VNAVFVVKSVYSDLFGFQNSNSFDYHSTLQELVLADAMDREVAFGADALDEDLLNAQEAEALPQVSS
jgi:hypothetical protein